MKSPESYLPWHRSNLQKTLRISWIQSQQRGRKVSEVSGILFTLGPQ